MKNGSLIFIGMCMCVLLTPAVESSGWGGSIGATYWLPDWDHDLQGFDSDTNGLLGPVLFLHYKKIGFGLQYYKGQFDIEFDDVSGTLDADRTDLDLMLSYRLTDIFQISVLYKRIEFDWTQTYKLETTIDGFGIGGGFNKVFPSRFLIYGFGFYMPNLDYSQSVEEGGDYDSDADGYWLEGGAGYIFPSVHLLMKVGYRYQNIDIDAEEFDWSETTSGFRAELSYYF